MLHPIKKWLTPIRLLAIGLILFALAVVFIGYQVRRGIWEFIEPYQTLLEDFYANVSAELISIFLTILVIDSLNERRSKEQEKRRLILQMGSPDNAFACEAARILRTEGWLEDGSLKGSDLAGTNLKGSDLAGANLEGVNLRAAYLKAADLSGVNLEGADLCGANLEEVNLINANLKGAGLAFAHLEGADLAGANLKGARLAGANLEEARLVRARLDGADLIGVNLERARLVSAHLVGANLKSANLEGVYFESATLPDGTKLPGRFSKKKPVVVFDNPEPDWRTPFEEWDKAGRPRIEPTDDEPDNAEES